MIPTSIPCIRVKDGVQFLKIAPSGFALLAALHYLAIEIERDITITSGTDGQHSGPNDPHHRGEAYDIRTHDLPDKQGALQFLKNELGEEFFFCWIEDENGPNEHIHIQVKKGTVYPPQDAASSQSEGTPSSTEAPAPNTP